MNYFLSKAAWLAAQPLSLTFLAIVGAFCFGLIKWRRSQSFFGILALVMLFVTLYTTVGTVLLQRLEDRVARAELPAGGPSCVIILGGSFEAEVIASRGGIELNQAGDRFVEALRLAKRYPQMQIVVSGGDGSFSGRYEGDAAVSMRFFTGFGVPAARIIQETTSRTTYENVRNTRQILEDKGLRSCLLVTSAFHMPRAVGLFRKAGIDVLPWPTDYRTSGRALLAVDFTQPSANAQIMTTAMREWVGLLVYYLTGRTHSLLPQ